MKWEIYWNTIEGGFKTYCVSLWQIKEVKNMSLDNWNNIIKASAKYFCLEAWTLP